MSKGWLIEGYIIDPHMYVRIFWTGSDWNLGGGGKIYSSRAEADEIAVGLLLAEPDETLRVVEAP